MRQIFWILIASLLICTVSDAKVVKGVVTCGENKLSGVVVTDGKKFTQTRKDGSFRLNVGGDAKHVYIVTPSGYTADWSDGSPAFYRKVSDHSYFKFDLLSTGKSSSYNIIAIGDPQPRTLEHFNEFADVPLDDIRQCASEMTSPAVGIALGDITFDKYALMKNWKQEIVKAGIPVYPVIGNHDHNRKINDDVLADDLYEEAFGPANYAFWLGNDVVVVLDNIIYDSGKKYRLGYTDETIDWVRKLMKYVPENADIYVAQHSPLNGRHYSKMIIGHDVLLDILEGHAVTFISGHNHTNGVFEYAPGVMEHNVAAICGTWWDVYHCTDGTPRGYKVFTKEDGKLTWYYKSIGKPRDFQYEVYLPGQARLHPESVVVNVWDHDPAWTVEWYQDGKPMGAMKQVEEYSPIHAADIKAKYDALGRKPSNYRLTRKAKHFFAATPSKEAKTVTVVIKDRFGNEWKEELTNIF